MIGYFRLQGLNFTLKRRSYVPSDFRFILTEQHWGPGHSSKYSYRFFFDTGSIAFNSWFTWWRSQWIRMHIASLFIYCISYTCRNKYYYLKNKPTDHIMHINYFLEVRNKWFIDHVDWVRHTPHNCSQQRAYCERKEQWLLRYRLGKNPASSTRALLQSY
jgi:hypothetical protein